MSQKKHYSKVSDLVEATASPEFVEAYQEHVARRQLVQKLQLMRAHAGLSQQDVAEKLGCTQSKISKVESGTDRDLSVAIVLDYANATGYDLQCVFMKDDTRMVEEVKYHFFETKELLEKLVKLADVDEGVAKGIAGFFGEACLNFITMLIEKVKALPPQAREHAPLVKLVSEIGEKKATKRTPDPGEEAKHCAQTNGYSGAKAMA